MVVAQVVNVGIAVLKVPRLYLARCTRLIFYFLKKLTLAALSFQM